jgi:hypothetical protein
MFESVPDDIERKIERYGTATIDLILDETGLDTLYPVHVLLEAYENRVAAVIDRFQVFFDWKPPGLNAEAMRCSVTLSREPVLAAPLHVREATGGGGERPRLVPDLRAHGYLPEHDRRAVGELLSLSGSREGVVRGRGRAPGRL